MQKLKPEKEKNPGDESKQSKAFKLVVTALKSKTPYQVLQPKVDLEKKTGLISVFHWVQQVDKEEDANCVLSDFKYQSVVTIPCLKNKDKISAGVQLTFCKPRDPEAEVAEPPQKKKRA